MFPIMKSTTINLQSLKQDINKKVLGWLKVNTTIFICNGSQWEKKFIYQLCLKTAFISQTQNRSMCVGISEF